MFLRIITLCCIILECTASVQITVEQGELGGEWRTTPSGRNYGAFEGVPFAQPPIGEKRYMEPQPLLPWSGVLQVTTMPNMCVQMYDAEETQTISFGDEDCLYMNIYSPKPANGEKLPVLVHIHAGAFYFGAGSLYGCEFMMEKDVVCITVNYRLGVIGFLSTQDDVLPGNNGLKDQTMAMKWIKDNIHNFGGDTDSITLWGTSAGGAALYYHMLSPLSKGLFHRGFSQSGAVCNPWVFQTKPRENAEHIAKSYGCSTSSSRDMIDCLNKIPALDLVKAGKLFMPFLVTPIGTFSPVAEPPGTKNAFITEHPLTMTERGESLDIPLISSMVLNEGIYPVSNFLTDFALLDKFESRWDELGPLLLYLSDVLPTSQHASAIKQIKEAYFNGEPISKKTIKQFIDMCSDRLFIMGIDRCTRILAQHNKEPIYMYQFSYSGEGGLGKAFSRSNINYGISHGDDLGYIMKVGFMDATKVPRDNEMLITLTEMITEFARTGKPKLGSADWPPVNHGEYKIMNITGPNEFYLSTDKVVVNEEVWKKLGID